MVWLGWGRDGFEVVSDGEGGNLGGRGFLESVLFLGVGESGCGVLLGFWLL